MSITLNNQPSSSHDEAPDQLITALRAWGINYLMGPSDTTDQSEKIPPIELIKRLAQCEYPRVRDASISLFLLHPELANAILEAYQTSETPVAQQIAVSILATLYLQRLWSFRLSIALGHIPDFLSSDSRCYGKIGTCPRQHANMVKRDWRHCKKQSSNVVVLH